MQITIQAESILSLTSSTRGFIIPSYSLFTQVHWFLLTRMFSIIDMVHYQIKLCFEWCIFFSLEMPCRFRLTHRITAPSSKSMINMMTVVDKASTVDNTMGFFLELFNCVGVIFLTSKVTKKLAKMFSRVNGKSTSR
jgi:hypothetical protein